jgi:tetratricopeptide (TPR) repeat protein
MSRLTCLALMVTAFSWAGDLACRSSAIAQDAPGISEGQRAAGEALLASGKAAYRAGNYTEALRSFQQALARLGRPAIYEDIGDAAGRLGDHQRAVDAYREYLGAMANAADRAEVEAKIKTHERALREAEGGSAKTLDLSPAAAASTTGEASAAGAPADTGAAADKSSGGELWWVWAGIGAAVVGTVIAALIVTSSSDPVQPPMRGSVGGTIQTLEVR